MTNKILITSPSLDERENVSGISTLVRNIIKQSDANFYHFQAGKLDGEKSDLGWFLKQVFLVPRFLLAIRREKIDVVHINTALVPLSIVRDAALVLAARIAKRPVLLHPNGGRFLMQDFDNRYLAWIAEKMFRLASKVLVLSEHEKASLSRRWQNLEISILPNAIATVEIPHFTRTVKDVKTIVFLGRLHESKGLNEIIEACKILKQQSFKFRFNCFGAGELQDFFVGAMSETLGADFHFGGVIAGAEKWEKLIESDIFLLPSRHGEGLPLAMLEAMAARCIVVVADIASVSAVVENGVNGFLVEPLNIAQLVEVLKRILENKVDFEVLQENAAKTIKEKYAIEDYVKSLEKIYAAMTETKRPK